MKYVVSLKIDCGTVEVEAESEFAAKQKAIIDYYTNRRLKGKDESFKYEAEVKEQE
ncbi:MAG: hypothetical protein LUD19_01200 [Clostridia bacterium]|nr:hypothetical protein [Clostridia bacterium]